MKIFEYPDVKKVVVSGDIHGDFRGLAHKLCVQRGLTDTLLIVAGDCGFGFERPGWYEATYNHLAKRLTKANNYVVFVRGNHDDPSYFAEEKVHYKRWRCVPDYTVIRAAGHAILCVGGAVSIDRKMRQQENAIKEMYGHKETALWWPDEAPEFRPDEIAAIPADVRIDTVVTHSAPIFCEPHTKGGLKEWALFDPDIYKDTDAERVALYQLALALKGHPLKEWFYGHYHCSHSEEIFFENLWHMMFIMLYIMEFREVGASKGALLSSSD